MFVHEILRLNGRKHADRPAVVTDDQVITFGELRDAAWQLANALRQLAGPGDRVAMLAENLPQYVHSYYGVPAAGMALTLLNYRLNPREWAWILDNADARVLLVQAKFLAQIEPLLAERTPSVEHIVVIDDGTPIRTAHPRYDDLLEAASRDEPPRDFDDDCMAWLVYTSGTTGFPKGAMLSHRNLTTAMLGSVIEYDHRSDDVNLVAFPLCHVSGYNVFLSHFRGGRIVLMPTFDPARWMQLVDQHEATCTSLATTMLNMVLQHPQINDFSLASLRGIGYGAAITPVAILRAAIARFGPIMYSGFGMTELGGNVLALSSEVHQRAIEGDEHLLESCGQPVCLADVRVVDALMNDCPPGVVGELVVRGDQVLNGYFRNEEATDAAFEGGWFHTGDMARRDQEGFFYIVDRMKDMIITGGENVYSREVEEVLYTHPGVSEAAVIGLPDPQWGERVVAVVVLRPGATVTSLDIIATARGRLASFKKPRQVIFTDQLPKTASGKIIKRELRAQLAAETS